MSGLGWVTVSRRVNQSILDRRAQRLILTSLNRTAWRGQTALGGLGRGSSPTAEEDTKWTGLRSHAKN